MNISIANIKQKVHATRKRDGNNEARIQASIVSFVRVVAPNCIVAHIPNGGLRSKREAARLKWVGVTAGFPDLILLSPSGRAYFIEVKTDTGRLSTEQSDFHSRLNILGFQCAIVRSIDDARLALKAWNIPTNETA